MTNQELQDFITNQLKAGFSKEEIKALLIQNGWLPTDVDAAFSVLGISPSAAKMSNGYQATAAGQAPATPSQGNLVADTSLGSDFNPNPTAKPVTNPVANPNPGFVQSPNLHMNLGLDQKTSSRSNKKLVVGIVVAIIVLVLGGAGAWAYFNYVAPDPQTTVNKAIANLASQIASKGIVDVKSSIVINASGASPQGAGSKATVNFNITSDVLSDVTANKMSADISFSGDFNVGSGMDIKVDGQGFLNIISSNNKLFIKINKIPSGLSSYLPMLISTTQLSFINSDVIGKWIEIDNTQMKSMAQAAGITALTNVNGTMTEAPLPSIGTIDTKGIMSALSDSNAFVVDQVLPSETVNGQGTFHYKVRLDKAGFTNFMLAVSKLINGGQYPKGVTELSMKDTVDQMFAQYDGSSNNGIKATSDIYVERFSKMPVKMVLNIDSSNAPQLKQSGIDSMTTVADVSYSFPSAANITEPDSYTSLVNLVAKASMAFMPAQQQSAVQVFPTMVPTDQLTSSRILGKRAKIQEEVSMLRSVAEILYSNNGSSYSKLCSGGLINTGIDSSLSSIAKDLTSTQSAISQSGAGITCVASANKYAVGILLDKSLILNGITSYCVDSTGVVGDNTRYTLNRSKLQCDKAK